MSYLLGKCEDLAVIACFRGEEGAYRVTEGLAQNEERVAGTILMVGLSSDEPLDLLSEGCIRSDEIGCRVLADGQTGYVSLGKGKYQ